MKSIVSLSLVLFSLISVSSCNGQNKAVEDQKKALEVMKQYSPKGVSPSTSCFMKANINGKPWEATNLIPDTDPGTSYHVNGEKDGVQIAFYVPLGYLKVGYTHKFTSDFVADFAYPDDVVFYGGNSGSFIVTKVDADGFEASFHFTATGNKAKGSVFDITDGTLRFPFPKKR